MAITAFFLRFFFLNQDFQANLLLHSPYCIHVVETSHTGRDAEQV